MQRRVLLGAGAVVLVVAGALALRSVTHRQVGAAVDQGIEQLVAALPPGTSVSHGPTGYNPLTGTLTVHDVVLKQADGAVLTADLLTVSGGDPQALHDVFDPAAYPAGKPAWTARRLLFADMALTGMHLTNSGPKSPDVRVKSLTLHRLSGRPFLLPPTEANRGQTMFQADAALAFALDSLDLHEAAIVSTDGEAASLSLGALTLSDYVGGQLGSGALKTIAIDAGKPGRPRVHVTLDAYDMKGADAIAALESARASGHASQAALARTRYSSVDSSGFVLTAAPGPRFSIDKIHAEQTASGPDGAENGQGNIHGVTFTLGDTVVPPAAAPLLAAFGLKSVTLDFDGVSHGHGGGASDFTDDLTLHDLGTLHLEGAIDGYDPAAASPDKPMQAVMATSIEEASLTWTDNSLTRRLLAVAAAQMHTTPELIRAQLAMPIVTLGLMMPDQPDAADQVTAFLNDPRKLTLTVKPPAKITIAEITSAPATTQAHLLGLHIAGQ